MIFFAASEVRETRKVTRRKTALGGVLKNIASDTLTDDLVVAVYLTRGRRHWMGRYDRQWQHPCIFYNARGKWEFTKGLPAPSGLPSRFKLIRMALPANGKYPMTTNDYYGWEEKLENFESHLAVLFAHELHHYRRYHLALHEREGEQSANRWARNRALKCGYALTAVRSQPPRKSLAHALNHSDPALLKRVKALASKLERADLAALQEWTAKRLATGTPSHRLSTKQLHAERLRALPPGTMLRIIKDSPRQKYLGRMAEKVRNLRSDSPRMAVRTSDGKEWHWPMSWLDS